MTSFFATWQICIVSKFKNFSKKKALTILVYKICTKKQDWRLLPQAVNICKIKAKFDKENKTMWENVNAKFGLQRFIQMKKYRCQTLIIFFLLILHQNRDYQWISQRKMIVLMYFHKIFLLLFLPWRFFVGSPVFKFLSVTEVQSCFLFLA